MLDPSKQCIFMDLTLPLPVISNHISNLPTIVERPMCLQSTTLRIVMGKKNTKDKKFTKFKAVGRSLFGTVGRWTMQ